MDGAGVKEGSPHVLRYTTAVHLLEAGVEVNVIRAWLGNVSLDTTNRYPRSTCTPSPGTDYFVEAEVAFVLVLKGRLRLHVQGRDEVTLSPSDSMQWSPTSPYHWSNPSRTVGSVAVFVFVPAVF